MKSRKCRWDLESPCFPLYLLHLRFTASALSSRLGKKVERKASPSASRLTPSSPVTRSFHLNTCTQLAASSRCSRSRQHQGPSPLPLRAAILPCWLCGFLALFYGGPVSGTLSFSVHRGMGLDLFLRAPSVMRSGQVKRVPLRFPRLPPVAQRS